MCIRLSCCFIGSGSEWENNVRFMTWLWFISYFQTGIYCVRSMLVPNLTQYLCIRCTPWVFESRPIFMNTLVIITGNKLNADALRFLLNCCNESENCFLESLIKLSTYLHLNELQGLVGFTSIITINMI